VPAGRGAWWAAALTGPEDASGLAVLERARHGAGSIDEVTSTLLAADLPALVALVSGLAADVATAPIGGGVAA
jgi:hypothetical protein